MSQETQPSEQQSAVRKQIFDCWQNGMGIGQTISSVERNVGAIVGFDQVRSHFVTLSERMA